MTVDYAALRRTQEQAMNAWPTYQPPKRETAEFSLEAGLLMWGAIREAYEMARWRGADISMFEGKGWLSRRFVFKGAKADIARLYEAIGRLERAMNETP